MQPQDLSIQKREIAFDFEPFDRYYFDNHPYKTHFMNALSTLFPLGEGQFIKSILNIKEHVKDQHLANEVEGFIGQEGVHSREHRQFNQQLTQLGYDLAPLDQDMQEWAQKERKKSFEKQLAKTLCLEHFTAILAHAVLKNDAEFLATMTTSTKAIWIWHAIEEIEHKGVAFDVYHSIYKNRFSRFWVMIEATREILSKIDNRTKYFLTRDGLWNKSMKRFGFKFKWGKNGILRSITKDYLEFFRFNFHPWNQNNIQMTKNWELEKLL